MTPLIHLAFRFHGNFYHSYRGDTPDELGFGKDIRIIRHLIATLDDLNARGVPVRGTWDFENYFSLQTIMPKHCPDVIAALQRRAAAGDEMELMSYNNGLISGHTAREFEEAIRRAVSNRAGSGVRDLFGEAYRPIVRPQEMMWTPIHLKLYRACGIEAISLYYSALPFNAFSNFIPPLSLVERYNPLTLTYPGIEETMTLLPCYNNGDLADHLTLRRWLGQMRKEQLALGQPVDLLLLVDMDADDEFWVGYDVPLLKARFSTISGLRGLVESVAGLDYLRFTTPGRYLDDHKPVGSITFGQDTADGAFDGYSSWTEKWSNHQMWTGIEQARMLDLQTRRLVGEDLPPEVTALLDESFEARLTLLSTTHFGMAAPVMNVTREAIGRDLARLAVNRAAAAFDRAAGAPATGQLSLLDFRRGELTSGLSYAPHASRALVRLPLAETAPQQIAVRDASGRLIPSAILDTVSKRELCFVESFAPLERKDYVLTAEEATRPAAHATLDDTVLHNSRLRVELDRSGQLARLELDGDGFSLGPFLQSGVTYGGKRHNVTGWATSASISLGLVALHRAHGSISIEGDHAAHFERDLLLAGELPYLYATVAASYPHTPDHGYAKGKAQRLQQAWDARWQEVWPCEVLPNLLGRRGRPLRVWKHNYCGHVSTFTLDYGRFSKNDQLDSINNQVTHGWVAVSDGERGVLVAHTADGTAGMACCPLRTRRLDGGLTVRFNPFGTYWGKQYRYATADTGLGKFLAPAASASDHINSYAPSYNGRTQDIRLMIAPYHGDAPPEEVQHDAEAFAYPYLVLSDAAFVTRPDGRRWEGRGLGEPPGERS